MGKRRSKKGLNRQLLHQFRTNDKESEWIARKTFGLPSKNDFLIKRVFPRNFNQELEKMRELHRSRGIKDETFLHPQRLREKGLPWKIGRRKLQITKDGGKRGDGQNT